MEHKYIIKAFTVCARVGAERSVGFSTETLEFQIFSVKPSSDPWSVIISVAIKMTMAMKMKKTEKKLN